MTATLPTSELIGLDYQVRFEHHDRFQVYELCAHCHRPMADGGAPLPGEGKTVLRNGERVLITRACASCWTVLLEIANAPEEEDEDRCDHGVRYDETCEECDEELADPADEDDDEEVVD